jgi:ATP-dependent 26S proteasome regulatory subunit
LDFLLDGLCPDIVIIVIIDDIDRVNGLSNASPTLFSIFTDMKDKHPGVIIILTTNNKYKLPDALLRPGRIDEIIEFENLDFEPRKEIFQSYINHHNVNIDYNLDDIVKEAVGLTAAYIKEIVIQMKYQSKKDVLKLVSRMRDISGVKAESPECSNSSNEPANEEPANEPKCETCNPIGVPSIT